MKVRNRRVMKDDVLIPTDIISLVNEMNPDEAKAFLLDILALADADNKAGYMKTDEEIEPALTAVHDELLEQIAKHQTPVVRYMFGNVAEKIKNNTDSYYKACNAKAENRKGARKADQKIKLTEEQENELTKVLQYLANIGAGVNEEQKQFVRVYISKGGNEAALSAHNLRLRTVMNIPASEIPTRMLDFIRSR